VTDGPESAGILAELERLRSENAALNEQVKLLVRAEQRLYRSQNELDAQLALVGALELFALQSSMHEEPDVTLARALVMLTSSFSIEWAGFAHPGAVPGEAFVSAAVGDAIGPQARIPVGESLEAWLHSVSGPGYSPFAPGAPEPCWQLLRLVAPGVFLDESRTRQSGIAYVPLRGAGAYAPGVMLTVGVHSSSAYMRGGPLGERHLPYLSLLANHVDHALSNTHLTRHLGDRSADLAESLARLESTQQELLHSQKMEAVGQLAAGVAHDFNNLLTVILGYAGTLSVSLPAGSPAHENVGKVTAAAQRAANLTRQLLALGRRQVQRRERFSLGEQCERTVDLLRRLVGDNIHVELQLQGSPGPIHADRSQLEQVLLNLMVNARDAMPQGGRLRITARPATGPETALCEIGVAPEGFVVLEVADDGIGMDAATLKCIFEPFFTTKPSGQGTGLGLAVVYGIVKQSQGYILVDSEPGRGTRVRVLLPIAAAPRAAAGPERTDACILEDKTPVRTGTTILVVEDEVAVRDVVRATLRRAGYVVVEAVDGEDALARVEARLPDLVLTDILMPGMGGLALTRELSIRHPAVRVAFMSGYAADFNHETDSIQRHDRFLPKPFTAEDLRAFVARQLAHAVVPDAGA
jgi:signal transduction histidine kinase/CheY-like chemotaxis protein